MIQLSSYPLAQQKKLNEQRTDKPPAKKSKGSKRRLRFVFVLFLCFAGWAAVTVWDKQITLNEKNAELQMIQANLDQAKLVNEQYEREISRLHDPEYIEQILRKDHLLTKEGETLFIKTR